MAEWDQRSGASGPGTWTRVEKPGVHIRYARGSATLPRIGLQMPGFIRSIGEERRWTRGFVPENGVTHVFSDNCYGACASLPGVSNVFMSHQLHPPVPFPMDVLARGMVRRHLMAFDEVWVPDAPDRALSGGLSAPLLPGTRYIGPLSRFQALGPKEDGQERPATDPVVLLGLVSGPEPQRTRMEEALRSCFLKDGRPSLILAGRPGGGEHREGRVLTVNDADDHRFREAVLTAECILCRSGYSTLMDLVVLGRRAVIVPTIGQPEQERLAREWSRMHGWTTLRTPDIASFTPGPMAGRTVVATGTGPEVAMRTWLDGGTDGESMKFAP